VDKMADARIFFSNPDNPKTLGSIVVSAWESETHSRSNNITTYPVEEGSDISDHIQNEPIELSVSGIIETVERGGNIIDAFIALEEIMISKQLITVVTGLKVYENMAITGIEIPRTSLNGGSLAFSASLREVRIVSSQAIVIPNTFLSDDNKQSEAVQDIGKTTSGQTQENAEEGFSFIDQVESQIDEIFGAAE